MTRTIVAVLAVLLSAAPVVAQGASPTPPPHAMQHGAMRHDAMKHDAMKHDAMKHDAMKHDAMKHDAMPHVTPAP
jgi:pentapeptide MXKDX repeat protein